MGFIFPVNQTEMDRFVSEEIKSTATKCNRMHECLTWSRDRLCKVTSTVNGNELYVACEHGKDCDYQHAVEGRTLCTCPVRLEVYRKYNI